MSDSTFDTFIHNLLRDYWRLHPVQATQSGVHDYDDRLPDLSADGQGERRAWRASQAAALRGFDDADLDATQRLDKRVALAHLALYDIQDDWGYARRAPAFYVEQALNGLHALLARPAAQADLSPGPSPEKGGELRPSSPPSLVGKGDGGLGSLDPLLARLQAIPTLLGQARAGLDPQLVAPEFLEIGRVAVRGAVGFI